MTTANNDYFYENTEIDLLTKCPDFIPINPNTKWVATSSADALSSNAGEQIRNLQAGEKLLIPFNDRNHLNGIMLKKIDGKLVVNWLDSYETYYLAQRQEAFLHALNNTLGSAGISVEPIKNIVVSQQGREHASCGPRTMDNLQRLAQGEPLAITQDQSAIRQYHMDSLGNDKFNQYQRFPSDKIIESMTNQREILEQKEAARFEFIIEALDFTPPQRSLASATASRSSSISVSNDSPMNSRSSSPNTSVSYDSPISSRSSSTSYDSPISARSSNSIDHKLSQVIELASMIYQTASSKLKEFLEDFVAISPALSVEERQSYWQDAKNTNRNDKAILEELGNKGFDYKNTEGLEQITNYVKGHQLKATHKSAEATIIAPPLSSPSARRGNDKGACQTM